MSLISLRESEFQGATRLLAQTDVMKKDITSTRTSYDTTVRCDELSSVIEKVEGNFEHLSAKKRELLESLNRLQSHQFLSALDLATIGDLQKTPASEELGQVLTDSKCSSSIPQLLDQIRSNLKWADSALLSIDHHLKIFKALHKAREDGYYQVDSVRIPEHARRVNNLIFFDGLAFSKPEYLGHGSWGIASKTSLADRAFVVKEPKPGAETVQHFENREGDIVKTIVLDNKHERDFYVPVCLEHPNIVNVVGEISGNPVMEYCSRGDLEKLLATATESGYPLDKAQTVQLLQQIASGIEYLHQNGIVHKDIKPANIFLTEDEDGNLVAKVGDFGSANSKEEVKRASKMGTPLYMSPEMNAKVAVRTKSTRTKFLIAPHSEKIDVWSMGHIIFEMITGGYNVFDGAQVGVNPRNPQAYFEPEQFAPCITITYSDKEKYTPEYFRRVHEIIKRKKGSKYDKIRDPALLEKLYGLCSDCMQKDPASRVSMSYVKTKLEEIYRSLKPPADAAEAYNSYTSASDSEDEDSDDDLSEVTN